MNLELLKKPLTSKEIDFRIQSISKKGYATILAYKDARADMNRLDEAAWVLGWKREHKLVGQNLHCIVSIYNEETKEWVSKEDVGTESMTEKEKGEASDSFKRACFNWGIGRELYDYPFICIKLNEAEYELGSDGKVKQTYDLKLKQWEWTSEFENWKLKLLSAKDDTGTARFSYKWKELKPYTPNPWLKDGKNPEKNQEVEDALFNINWAVTIETLKEFFKEWWEACNSENERVQLKKAYDQIKDSLTI